MSLLPGFEDAPGLGRGDGLEVGSADTLGLAGRPDGSGFLGAEIEIELELEAALEWLLVLGRSILARFSTGAFSGGGDARLRDVDEDCESE